MATFNLIWLLLISPQSPLSCKLRVKSSFPCKKKLIFISIFCRKINFLRKCHYNAWIMLNDFAWHLMYKSVLGHLQYTVIFLERGWSFTGIATMVNSSNLNAVIPNSPLHVFWTQKPFPLDLPLTPFWELSYFELQYYYI